MGIVFAGVGLPGSEFGFEFEKPLGTQAVGLPDTDTLLGVAVDLPGILEGDPLDSLEGDHPGSFVAAGLLGSLVATDPDNALEAGDFHSTENWSGTVDQEVQILPLVPT